jgi:bacterioferritin-associated ferredoxin
MIVCHCHRVTDREIRACVQAGARSSADVAETCGASGGCGGCEPLVADIVQAERRQLAVLRSDAAAAPRGCLAALAGEPALQSA